jgi:hypothetical protein
MKKKKLGLDRQTIAVLTPRGLRRVRGGCPSGEDDVVDDTYRDITPLLSKLTCEG